MAETLVDAPLFEELIEPEAVAEVIAEIEIESLRRGVE